MVKNILSAITKVFPINLKPGDMLVYQRHGIRTLERRISRR